MSESEHEDEDESDEDCLTDEAQQLPTSGVLRENADLERIKLHSKLASQLAPVYGYVMRTLHLGPDGFSHTGCGPNFQGGILTICTCKRLLRTYRDVKHGTWIAGFDGVGNERNDLFYLAKSLAKKPVILTRSNEDSRFLEVIDGQQRLTTLTILFSVLRDLYFQKDNRVMEERLSRE